MLKGRFHKLYKIEVCGEDGEWKRRISNTTGIGGREGCLFECKRRSESQGPLPHRQKQVRPESRWKCAHGQRCMPRLKEKRQTR